MADDAEATQARMAVGARAPDELTAFLDRVIDASVADRAVKAAAQALGAEPGERTDEGPRRDGPHTSHSRGPGRRRRLSRSTIAVQS
ncbi:hypothetical protein M2160_000429 [Streptomyces sp. SAI-117]|uniref:hypothetical protein n=1 Tax=Streptomyces sp. SAI-117 TaxID=2940546 RepID=UPI0024730231|nr:hypothetical protein [Streptomyces sp. SAI-117]MDH6565408.1 hypothetical protein [Streptomyces sp. SAI-117]